MKKSTNYYSPERLLEKAMRDMTKVGLRNMSDFGPVVKAMARTGKPCETQFNHYNIKYCTKDEYGMLCLRWIVSDGITGRQETFKTKDWISEKSGNIMWQKLVAAMKKV